MESGISLPSGKLSNLRVKDLQRELRKRQLPTVGRKAELITRLAKFIADSENKQDSMPNQENTRPVFEMLTVPMEVGLSSQEKKQLNNKEESYRLRNHTGINETSESVKDVEETMQLNVILTPLCDARSLTNAGHRKSSRHSKEKLFGRKSGDPVTIEADHTHTPIFSKRPRRSAEGKESRNDNEIGSVTNCLEKQNVEELRYGCVEDTNTQLKYISQEKKNSSSERSSPSDVGTIQYSATHKSIWPRGSFASQTFSSAARSVQRKVTLLPSLNGSNSREGDISNGKNKLNSKLPYRAKSTRGVLDGLPLSSRPIKKTTRNASEFFARNHASIFAKMETLGERQTRIIRRHEEIMRAVPKVANRLATPKATRIPFRLRNADMSTNKPELSFESSNVIASVTGTSVNFAKSGALSSKQEQGTLAHGGTSFSLKFGGMSDERDLKSRTKNTIQQRKADNLVSVAKPVENALIDMSAALKGMTPTRSAGKISYTPRRGAVGAFVDTSKLTDREFELAVANGLIKARSLRSTSRKEESRRSREMVIKKKAKKNAAFNKIKLKVGKKLKKTSTTDTTIKTKKVVLLSQLQEKNGTSEKPLSYRGLSLDELCKQLGHFSKSVRNGALVGTKQLLMSHPDLVESHLRILVPSVARLIPHCGSDPALSGQLRGLIRVICNASPHSMTAHFTLFVAHLLHALTHNEARVRSFSLSIIALVLCTYPDLCSKNADLFTAFIKFLGGSHKPRWSSPGFLETIVSFIKAYTADRSNRKDVCTEIQLNMDTGEVPVGVNLLKTFSKSNPFDFPVINSSIPTTVSPLEVPESLLSLSEACAPILAMSLSEDRSGSFLGPATSILSLLGNAALNLPNASVVEDFIPRMRKIWTSVKKVATSRKSEKVARATRWLNDF
ncbi:hypothetical protein Angca_009500 [Angiostrongylus cantonensis]|nr:hypothetical protein Angca_009500 [Angiostrongylus cantonensis]